MKLNFIIQFVPKCSVDKIIRFIDRNFIGTILGAVINTHSFVKAAIVKFNVKIIIVVLGIVIAQVTFIIVFLDIVKAALIIKATI